MCFNGFGGNCSWIIIIVLLLAVSYTHLTLPTN